MKSENKNYEKAEKLFDSYFNENGSAFLYSVGTIGPKYVWTYADQKIILISKVSSGRKIFRRKISFFFVTLAFYDVLRILEA